MTSIRLDQFGGMAPRVSKRLLPKQLAQSARNGRLLSGELRGTRTPPILHIFPSTTRNAILIRKLDGTEVWFGLQSPASDIVKGPLINDSLERYYWSGEAAGIRYNSADRIEDGLPAYDLGTPAPTTGVTINVTGGSGLSETRAYTYTFVNEWGEESAPAPVTLASGYVNGTWELTTIAPDGDFTDRVPPEFIRIYRTVTGQATVSYFLVDEVAYNTTTYNDTSANVDVAKNSLLQSFSWATPPETVGGLVVHPNGFMVAFNGRDLYLSESYRPHAWPAEYVTTVEDEIVGVTIYNNMIAVLTLGRPVFFSGSRPANLNPIKSESAEPCLSKNSIAATIGGVLYASPNGLVLYNEQGPVVVTKPILTLEEWAAYDPSSLKGAQLGMEYIGFYSAERGFRYAPGEPLANFVEIDSLDAVDNIVTDLPTGKVWLLRDNRVEEWEPTDGIPMYYRWLSKEFDFAKPVNLGAIMIKFDSGGGFVTDDQLTMYELYNQEFVQAVAPQAPIAVDEQLTAGSAEIVGAGYTILAGLMGAQAATVEGEGSVYPVPEFVAAGTQDSNNTSSTVDLPNDYDKDTDLFLGISGYMNRGTTSIYHDFNKTSGGAPTVADWSQKTPLTQGTDDELFDVYTGAGPWNGDVVHGSLRVALFRLSANGYASMGTNMNTGFSAGIVSYAKRVLSFKNVYRDDADTSRRVFGAFNADPTENDPASVDLPGVTSPNDNSLLIAVILSKAHHWNDAGESFTTVSQSGEIWVGYKLVPAGATGDITMYPLDSGGDPDDATKALGCLICLDIIDD